MARLAVVFDTNAYRGVGRERFEAIRRCEASRGISAYASFFVTLELLAHTADPGDKAYSSASAALRRLWAHCKQYQPGRDVLRLLGDSEAQVPLTLFGRAPVGRDPFYDQLGYVVGRFCDQGYSGWEEGQQFANSLLPTLEALEARFAEDLFNALVTATTPGAGTWSDVIASSRIRETILARIKRGDGHALISNAVAVKAAAELNLSPPIEELSELAKKVGALFPLPVYLYDRIVLDVLERGLDMSRPDRANSLWDYQIAFSTGRGATISGAPVWLVSTDKRMLDAASESGLSAVKTLAEYERLLSVSIDEFESALSG